MWGQFFATRIWRTPSSSHSVASLRESNWHRSAPQFHLELKPNHLASLHPPSCFDYAQLEFLKRISGSKSELLAKLHRDRRKPPICIPRRGDLQPTVTDVFAHLLKPLPKCLPRFIRKQNSILYPLTWILAPWSTVHRTSNGFNESPEIRYGISGNKSSRRSF